GSLQLTPRWHGSVQGIWSAATELGLVTVVFILMPRPLALSAVIAVGVGSACAELLFLVAIGVKRRHASQTPPPAGWVAGASESFVVRHFFFIKGAIAIIGLFAAGPLFYASVLRWSLGPAFVAFTCFAIIDGAASYGHRQNWDWFRPRVAHRYYATAAAVAL